MLLESLRAAFSGRLLTGADAAPFLIDYRGKWTGQALAVAQPDSADEVAKAVAWCHAHRVPVVPQGGNTGLSGGSVPQTDPAPLPLVISLARLNRIRAVDPLNNTIVVEAGVTLLQVQEAAKEVGRLFPLSLAAEGTCTIGGNLASNAGGVQVLGALATGLVFLLVNGLLSALGEAGTMAPRLAAWLAPALFSLLGLVFVFRLDRH